MWAVCENRVRLMKITNKLKFFPATEQLQSVIIDILGPLTQSSKCRKFIGVITDRFTKLTQAVSLLLIHSLAVAEAFAAHRLFQYGPPRQILFYNGSQLTSKFFLGVFKMMGIGKAFTTTYHLQTNGQTERYNRTIWQMLLCYVAYHQNDWYVYINAL